MIEVVAESFNPFGGPEGTPIHVRVARGAIEAPPGKLKIIAASLHSLEDGTYYPCESSITDRDYYTAFSIIVPQGIKVSSHYGISLSLYSTRGDTWKIESARGSYFIVTTSADRPKVTRINPSRVSKQNLLSTIFRIDGSSLDRLDKNTTPQILSSPPIRLNFIQLNASGGKLKVAGGTDVHAIRSGSFRVRFLDYIDGGIIFSQNSITITEN